MKKLFYPLIMAVIFTACQKQPTATIKVSSANPTAGQPVTFTSVSENADHVKWTFPTGQTSTSKQVNYTFMAGGIEIVKLEAFSKNSKKKDEAQITVAINPGYGNVIFWQDGIPSYGITDVTINGVTKSITVDKTSIPDCGDSGCATFYLQEGDHYFSAQEQSGSSVWSGYITITTNGCLKMELN